MRLWLVLFIFPNEITPGSACDDFSNRQRGLCSGKLKGINSMGRLCRFTKQLGCI